MNLFIFISAVISLLLTCAHISHGGVQFHLPVLESNLPNDQKAIYSIIWHFVTLALLVNSIVLFLGAFRENVRNAVWLVIAQYIAFTGLFLFYGMTRLGSIAIFTQWVFFFLISAIGMIGLLRRNS